MEILSVSLSHFKIHRDSHFEFQPGVNAICGENGSGKTSILEAIAWVLFDYNSGYQKDDLRHQNSGSTKVTVKFISNADGRVYVVQRRSLRGKSDTYEVFDPQLNSRLDGISRVEEAQRWLKEHLAVPAQMDLAKLFGEVIGIPQGTFTLDFLKTSTERRKIFDPILAVEDYKAAYLAANKLQTYAEGQTRQIEAALGLLDERLQDEASLIQQAQQAQQQLDQTEQALATLRQDLAQLQDDYDTLQHQADQIQTLQRQLDTSNIQYQAQHQTLAQQQQALAQAQAAQARCDEHQADYIAYQSSDRVLQHLSQQQQQRDRLRQQQTAIDQQRTQIQLQQARLQSDRQRLHQAQAELDALGPAITQQQTLTTELTQVQAHLQALQLKQQAQQTNQQQLQIASTDLPPLLAEIQQLQNASKTLDRLPELDTQIEDLQRQLAQVGTTQHLCQTLQTLNDHQTQAHQRHQRQVRKCLKALIALIPSDSDREAIAQTLEAGLTLHKTQISDLKTLIRDLSQRSDYSQLQQHLTACQADRHQLLQQQMATARLPLLQQQAEQLQTTIKQLKTQIKASEKDLKTEPSYQQQQHHLLQQLETLGNPQSHAQLLTQQLAQLPEIETQWQQLEQQLKTLSQTQTALSEQLHPYTELEAQLSRQESLRQTHQPGYLCYLQNQQEAERLGDRQAALAATQQSLSDLGQRLSQLQQALAQAVKAHDPEQLSQVSAIYSQRKTEADQLSGALPGQQRDLQRLHQELAQRQLWRQERDRLQQDRERKQTIQQFILDARRIYNQSSGRITQYYLNEIVREGDRLFRELMNRPGVALNWTEDYEIQIQEGSSVWRNFKTLSGGEQMAAALAVRLALLKVIADIDIAFFDEPTTNMDRPRREQLAEALANLKTFRQLFVISHDDTFEHVTENIIRVERLT